MPVPRHPSPPRPTRPDSNGDASVNSNITPPPEFPGSTGYPFVRQLTSSTPLSQLGPVERSKALDSRKVAMKPYLQFMCGPLLRYDTVDEHGVWHGAALIVSECCCFSSGLWVGANTRPSGTWGTSTVAADAGSTYEPYPTLKYRCYPQRPAPHQGQHNAQGTENVDMAPRSTASPTSLHLGNQANDEHLGAPHVQGESVLGAEIYVYSGRVG
jgi:hypothetical protein